jgi:hypothetical protein
MSKNQSIIDRLLEERLSAMRNTPDKIRELEKRLETGKMTPAEVRAAHELLASLKKNVARK